jgi:hypothetical protein
MSKERERKAKSGKANRLLVDNFDESIVNDRQVSQRCVRALAPSTPYLLSFLRGLEYPCDPTLRPDGYIPLCM